MSEYNCELDAIIKHNLEEVRHNIAMACKKVGRDIGEVELLAVSKTKPIEYIESAFNADQVLFGENKVQEIIEKYDKIDSVRWHMIGHLQTNKVKYIIDKVELIHSVDSLKLAQTISKEAIKKDVVANILIEVNVAQEDSKFGISINECEDFVREVAKLPNVKIRGLMTIAPFVDNPEENRVYFRKLKEELVDINNKKIHNVNRETLSSDKESQDIVSMDILSMGMTNDYEVAIEEGSTLVRVGTGIFGVR
jgi:pyridoxal phosphate enzyme (YggS family)